MQFTIGTTYKGSQSLCEAFKQLAPRGLILEIIDSRYTPTLYYSEGRYLYESDHTIEVMDGAWNALQNTDINFKVVNQPLLRYTTTKALHD